MTDVSFNRGKIEGREVVVGKVGLKVLQTDRRWSGAKFDSCTAIGKFPLLFPRPAPSLPCPESELMRAMPCHAMWRLVSWRKTLSAPLNHIGVFGTRAQVKRRCDAPHAARFGRIWPLSNVSIFVRLGIGAVAIFCLLERDFFLHFLWVAEQSTHAVF